MSSYAEAGIRQYRIEAVLDEQTTNICRYLHGKTFSVADALRRFDRGIEAARGPPRPSSRRMPWVRARPGSETGRTRALNVDGGGGRTTTLAEVTRSAMGTRTTVGTSPEDATSALASDSRGLNEVDSGDRPSGPPYHGASAPTPMAEARTRSGCPR